MKLLEAISNHIGTVWYLQTKKKVVYVIFMKCVQYLIFLIMLLILISIAACIFLVFLTCTWCNVMFVYNEILLYFYIIKAEVEVIAKGTVCRTKKKYIGII